MNACNRFGPETLVKARAESGERDGRIWHQKKHLATGRFSYEVSWQKHYRRTCFRDFGFVFGVAQKRQITGYGFVERSDATDSLTRSPSHLFGLRNCKNLVRREVEFHDELTTEPNR